jgi:lipopolysaccharide/colanic/teichoic acid biosynthesis glycosyltransferase
MEPSRSTTQAAIGGKIQKLLSDCLQPTEADQVDISFHFFPESNDSEGTGNGTSAGVGGDSERVLYSDRHNENISSKTFAIVKRATDIAGSLVALTFFSPLFLIIAILIKMTSAGPVFYRQKRKGMHGVEFTFLKFRSMYVANDSKIHREFTQNLIRGNTENKTGFYKIQKDPRITPFGRILRSSSLDELPQFFNVLMGEMSLVGPRPPIPYEFECYQLWHRRRILEAKPASPDCGRSTDGAVPALMTWFEWIFSTSRKGHLDRSQDPGQDSICRYWRQRCCLS